MCALQHTAHREKVCWLQDLDEAGVFGPVLRPTREKCLGGLLECHFGLEEVISVVLNVIILSLHQYTG